MNSFGSATITNYYKLRYWNASDSQKNCHFWKFFENLIVDLWRTIAKLNNQVKPFLAIFKHRFSCYFLKLASQSLLKKSCMFSA